MTLVVPNRVAVKTGFSVSLSAAPEGETLKRFGIGTAEGRALIRNLTRLETAWRGVPAEGSGARFLHELIAGRGAPATNLLSRRYFLEAGRAAPQLLP